AADHKVRSQKQERHGRELPDIDGRAPVKSERRMACREQFHGTKGQARKAVIVRLDGTEQILREMNFAALKHGKALAARGFDDLYLDVRKTLRIAMQKLREHAFDMLGRGGDDQRSRVAFAQKLRPFADRGRVVQEAATVAQELLSLAGQHQAASNAIKQLEP